MNLLLKITDKIEQFFPNLGVGSILVLLTIAISTTIGFILAIALFLQTRNISASFNLFIYSFLSCLSGSVLGSLAGAILGTVVFGLALIGSDGMFGGLGAITAIVPGIYAFILCWLFGILIGAFIAATPLLESSER